MVRTLHEDRVQHGQHSDRKPLRDKSERLSCLFDFKPRRVKLVKEVGVLNVLIPLN